MTAYWIPDLDEDDLAAFVRADDRHRSLTVVREEGDRDTVGEAKRWIESVRRDAGEIDACHAMQVITDRHADGSREGQRAGIIAAVRFDEQGHRGLAAALDTLFSVRAKDPRDFWRMVEWARRLVLDRPSTADDLGCDCDERGNHGVEKLERPSRPELSGTGPRSPAAGHAEHPSPGTDGDPAQVDTPTAEEIRSNLVAHRAAQIEIEEEARRLVAKRKRGTRPSIRERLIDVRALKDVSPPRWLIRGLIPERAVGFLAGRYGTYKSFVAVSWACTLAAGKAWQGDERWTVREPVRVLYVAAEGAPGVAERVQAWEAVHGELAEGSLVVYPEPIRLSDPEDVEELDAIVAEFGFDLVIVDTFHRSAPGREENSSTEIGEVLEAMMGIRDRHGCSTLFLDHTGHAGRTMRGSSAKGDDADFVTLIDLPGDERTSDQQRTMRVAKTKDREQDGAWDLRLRPVDLPPVDGEERRSAVVEIGRVGALDGEVEIFGGGLHWWESDVAVPEKALDLKGKGSTIAIDIVKVLTYVGGTRGLTQAEIKSHLKRPNVKPVHPSVVSRALALLEGEGFVVEGEKAGRLALARGLK